MSHSSLQTKKITVIGIMSALGSLLMLIELPTFTGWLKFDISDLTVLITASIFGPFSAIIVAFIKAAIHFLLHGSPTGVPIDQLTAFLSSLSYMLPFYVVLKVFRKINSKLPVKIAATVFGTVFLTLIMTYLNYIWITPLYYKLLGWPIPQNFYKFIVSSYIPFNLLKGGIMSVLFILISRPIEIIAGSMGFTKDNILIAETSKQKTKKELALNE